MEIICKGSVTRKFSDSPYKADVNYSDVFSFLIKEVGTKVSHYQSDLFYDLRQIENAIQKDNPKNESFLVGLREMGVDSKGIIELKMEHPECYSCEYINIYSVDIKVDGNDIVVVLGTVK